MKNQTVKKSAFTSMILLMGVFLLSNTLVAQETTRRVLRGSRISEPPPEAAPVTPASTGGSDPLGEDPSRAESGRPGSESPEGEEPITDDPTGGGAGDPEENQSPEMNDPAGLDPDGGTGDPEENQPPRLD